MSITYKIIAFPEVTAQTLKQLASKLFDQVEIVPTYNMQRSDHESFFVSLQSGNNKVRVVQVSTGVLYHQWQSFFNGVKNQLMKGELSIDFDENVVVNPIQDAPDDAAPHDQLHLFDLPAIQSFITKNVEGKVEGKHFLRFTRESGEKAFRRVIREKNAAEIRDMLGVCLFRILKDFKGDKRDVEINRLLFGIGENGWHAMHYILLYGFETLASEVIDWVRDSDCLKVASLEIADIGYGSPQSKLELKVKKPRTILDIAQERGYRSLVDQLFEKLNVSQAQRVDHDSRLTGLEKKKEMFKQTFEEVFEMAFMSAASLTNGSIAEDLQLEPAAVSNNAFWGALQIAVPYLVSKSYETVAKGGIDVAQHVYLDAKKTLIRSFAENLRDFVGGGRMKDWEVFRSFTLNSVVNQIVDDFERQLDELEENRTSSNQDGARIFAMECAKRAIHFICTNQLEMQDVKDVFYNFISEEVKSNCIEFVNFATRGAFCTIGPRSYKHPKDVLMMVGIVLGGDKVIADPSKVRSKHHVQLPLKKSDENKDKKWSVAELLWRVPLRVRGEQVIYQHRQGDSDYQSLYKQYRWVSSGVMSVLKERENYKQISA